MRDIRGKLLAGFGLVAVPLLAVSVAYACTVYKGAFTVTLGAGGSGSQTVYGDASMTAPQMYWCTGANNGAGVADPDPAWGALSMTHGANTTLSWSMADATAYNAQCVGADGLNKMKNGTGYVMEWHKGLMPGGGEPNHNCHSGKQQKAIPGATNIQINNGAGAGGPYTFNTAPGPNPGFLSVCLYDDFNRPDAGAVNIDVL